MKKKILIYSLIALVFLIIGAELVARFSLGLGDPPLSIADSTVEYMFKPNQDCRRFGNRILINEWGMRSRSIASAKKDKTELRVLWFGDSVINGGNQTDHDSLATSILEKMLASKLGVNVRVMNVSAGSWGPPNMLAYRRKFGGFDADIVIVSLSSHDVSDFPTFAPLNPLTHPTQKPFCALWEGMTRYLPRYLPKSCESGKVADYTIDTTRTAQVMNSLDSLITLSNQGGAKVLLTHHWEQSELKKGAQVGYGLLKDFAAKKELVFLTDSLEFAKNDALYRDNIHPNNAGQKQIASLVYEALSQNGFLLR